MSGTTTQPSVMLPIDADRAALVPEAIAAAGPHKTLEQRVSLLVGATIRNGRVLAAGKAQALAMHNKVDVLREPMDQAEGFGERGSALEEELRVAIRQPVEENIQDQKSFST